MTEQTIIKSKKVRPAERRREKIPCLIVVEGNNIGETYYLSKNSVTIGRGDGVDIFLTEEGVSRQHARIDQHENAFSVIDLGSTNGTYLNGDLVEHGPLKDGDKVRLGEVVLKFSFQDIVDVDFQARLRNLAMRDGLTRLFNRRYFMESLVREISFALRKRQPLTCILLDIDHFKQVNDTYGHQVGDMVLRGISRKLVTEVRGYDIVARYGGEEFAILLRSTALDHALILAERIRRVIEGMLFEIEGKKLKATVSLGVSALDPDRAQTAEDLLKQADRFLYEAKNSGRNRLVSPRNTAGLERT